MGDGFDIVNCRRHMENSSIKENVDLRHLANDFEKEIERIKHPKDPKSFPFEPEDAPQRNSGEPGHHQSKKNIPEFRSNEDNSMLEMAVTESEVVPFPYADTKLRPEAPPFTPECVSPDPEPGLAEGEPDGDGSCFVNVELKVTTTTTQGEEEGVFPEVVPAPLLTVKHQREAKENEDGEFQRPFSLAFASNLKESTPDVEPLEVALDEEDRILAVGPTTLAASETREAHRAARVNILSPAFFLGNKTQIIVLLASIIVCVILVIFVLV